VKEYGNPTDGTEGTRVSFSYTIPKDKIFTEWVKASNPFDCFLKGPSTEVQILDSDKPDDALFFQLLADYKPSYSVTSKIVYDSSGFTVEADCKKKTPGTYDPLTNILIKS